MMTYRQWKLVKNKQNMTLDPQERYLKDYSFNELWNVFLNLKQEIDYRKKIFPKCSVPKLTLLVGGVILINNSKKSKQEITHDIFRPKKLRTRFLPPKKLIKVITSLYAVVTPYKKLETYS